MTSVMMSAKIAAAIPITTRDGRCMTHPIAAGSTRPRMRVIGRRYAEAVKLEGARERGNARTPFEMCGAFSGNLGVI